MNIRLSDIKNEFIHIQHNEKICYKILIETPNKKLIIDFFLIFF